MSYTEHQIHELARCADPVTGPQHFMDNYFFIQHPTKGAIQYHPFEYQERLIETWEDEKCFLEPYGYVIGMFDTRNDIFDVECIHCGVRLGNHYGELACCDFDDFRAGGRGTKFQPERAVCKFELPEDLFIID